MYRIVTEGYAIDCSFKDLIRNFEIDCEIYDITHREIYLGKLSREALVYIATEYFENALNRLIFYELSSMIDNPKRAKMIEDNRQGISREMKCLKLCRRWFGDPDSVTIEEINGQFYGVI
jgi:hypothetical protein